jgi:hypothetical protein
MSPELTLYILRLMSAALLLTFLGALVWFVRSGLRDSDSAETNRAPSGLLILLDDESTPTALRPVTSIGRSPGNTVVIDKSYVSAEHALLTRRDSQWWLEDLSSRNGTALNDVLITQPVAVTNGDIITIGDTQLKLELDDA